MTLILILQAYKFIFTSPTSAEEIENEKDLEGPAARPAKRSRRHRAPTRGHIANIMGMKSVTPRSIAYVAVQVSAKFPSPFVQLIHCIYSYDLPCPMQVLGMGPTAASTMLISTIILSTSLKRHPDLPLGNKLKTSYLGGQGILFLMPSRIRHAC